MTWFFHHSPRLSPEDVRELVERAAAISDTALPLASGLRAAASEVSSRRLRRAMQQLATRVDRGESWSELLQEQMQWCPEDLRGTLLAARASGRADEVLSQYVKLRAIRRDLVLSIRSALAYPAWLMLFAAILLVAFSLSVLPELDSLLYEWQSRTVGAVQFIRWWTRSGVWWCLKLVPIALVAIIVCRWAMGAPRWRRILYRIPLVGPLWQWLGVVEWSRLLSSFVSYNLPLPESVRWASVGSLDANIRESGLELAHAMEAGESLSQTMERQHRWPTMLPALLRSAQDRHDLPSGLAQAAAYFEERLQMRLALVRTVVPPLLFALVGTGIIFVFGSMLTLVYVSVKPFTWPGSNSIFSFAADGEIVVPFALLGPFAFGVVLIWTISVTRRHRTDRREESLLELLELIGWLLLVGSMLGCFYAAAGSLTWICFPIFAVVALVLVQRCRDAEKQALVHTLTMAAEQGVPLDDAVQAFARERAMTRNHRISELADLLHAGLPLPQAIQQARLRLPSEVALAVQVGSDTGHLGMALRESLTWTAATSTILASLLERVFYICLIVGVATPAFYSVIDTTMPIMQEMAGELGSGQLQAVGVWQAIQNYPSQTPFIWLAVLGSIAQFGLLGCGNLCLLFYVRWLSTDLPILRKFWFPWERAIVLLALSTAVRHRQSIAETLRLLHSHHPKRSIRRRLEKAARMANAGGDWRAGLLKAGFINRREEAVLQAADRLDNVGWALREVADRRLQRITLRVRNLLNILVPLLVLIAGLLVLAIAAAQFEMLSGVIEMGARL